MVYVLSKVMDFLKVRPRSKYRIEAADDGLRCSGTKEGTQTISWDSIVEISGLKRDQVTTDLTCLAIRYFSNGEKTVEINEDMEGFENAVRELERRKFLRADWRKFVTLPPFQTRRFVLFNSSSKSY